MKWQISREAGTRVAGTRHDRAGAHYRSDSAAALLAL
jgi:hypothetical protein